MYSPQVPVLFTRMTRMYTFCGHGTSCFTLGFGFGFIGLAVSTKVHSRAGGAPAPNWVARPPSKALPAQLR